MMLQIQMKMMYTWLKVKPRMMFLSSHHSEEDVLINVLH